MEEKDTSESRENLQEAKRKLYLWSKCSKESGKTSYRLAPWVFSKQKHENVWGEDNDKLSCLKRHYTSITSYTCVINDLDVATDLFYSVSYITFLICYSIL